MRECRIVVVLWDHITGREMHLLSIWPCQYHFWKVLARQSLATTAEPSWSWATVRHLNEFEPSCTPNHARISRSAALYLANEDCKPV